MDEIKEFLSLYNKLDSLARAKFNLDDRSESAIMALINSFRHSDYYRYNDLGDDLDAIRSLRNSLVHNPSINGESLISLNPLAIKKLQEIVGVMENPPLAKDRAIPFNKLYCVHLHDSLLSSMCYMSLHGYSHAPVLDEEGKLIGVFSEDTVFSYLADKGETNLKDGDLVESLFEYLPLEKHRNERYVFLSKMASLEEVVKEFEESKRTYGKRLGLVFITEHGKSNERILYALASTSIF
jgi:CBS domain-containing protein